MNPALPKHPAFLLRQLDPPNGGPPPDHVLRNFVTPTDLFFTRNHGPIPELDVATYRLPVRGLVRQPLELSVDGLRRNFPRHTVPATIQCAGNRRDDLMRLAPVPGEVPWGGEAISHGEWTGARLADVLAAAGVDTAAGAAHVEFIGLDHAQKEGRRYEFGGSVPLDKALSPETLLAYEMNGAPLTPLHGFPLRAVVPGFIGARSVKWLSVVNVRPDPSPNQFQSKYYRLFPTSARPETVDWGTGMELGELSVNSFICGVRAGPDHTVVEGWAMAGGGRPVRRVEVSADHGAHWTEARLRAGDGVDARWSWCFWCAELPGEPEEIVARAWDSAANTQPESAAGLWNFKGYMNNAWHRVRPGAASGWPLGGLERGQEIDYFI